MWQKTNDYEVTGKPSSLKMSLVACNIPVYFDDPYMFLWTKAHEVVGSSWTYEEDDDK